MAAAPAAAIVVDGVYNGPTTITPSYLSGLNLYVPATPVQLSAPVSSSGTILGCQFWTEWGGLPAAYDSGTGLCTGTHALVQENLYVASSAWDDSGSKPVPGPASYYTVDSAAPETTPSGNGGAYSFGTPTNQDVTVGLSCSDGSGSGCAGTKYSLDGDSFSDYSSGILFDSEGTYTLYFYSTDFLGQTEEMKSVQVIIDKTAPSFEEVAIWSNRDDNSSFARIWEYVYVSASGASEEFSLSEFTIAGRLPGTGAEQVEPDVYGQAQMVPSDPSGTVPFEFTVTDGAGNSATFTEENTTEMSENQGYFVYYDNRPDYTYVSKEYCEPSEILALREVDLCYNDGHTWGYDAFDSIQDGVDGVYSWGYVYVTDSEYYNESVLISKPANIYGTSFEPEGISSQGTDVSGTQVFSITFDSAGIYTSGVSTPWAIVTPNGELPAALQAVEPRGKLELTPGTWSFEGFELYKPVTIAGAGKGNSTLVFHCSNFQIYADNVLMSGVSIEAGEECTPSYGIYLYGENFTFEDSAISGFPYGIYSTEWPEWESTLTVSGSDLYGTQGEGCYYDDSVSTQDYCESGYGLYVQYQNLAVSNTTITDFWNGIYFYSEGSGECCSENSVGAATELPEDSWTPRVGIFGTQVSKADQNEYYWNDDYGLQIYSDRLEVSDSSVSGFKYGIYSSRGNNTITRTNATRDWDDQYDCYSTYGMRIYGNANLLSGINVSGYEYAVQANGRDLVIEDFDLFGKPDDSEDGCYPGEGIDLQSRGTATVRNGKISNFNRGIDIEGNNEQSDLAASTQFESQTVTAQHDGGEYDWKNTTAAIENVTFVGGSWDEYYYDSISSQDCCGEEYMSETAIDSEEQNNLTVRDCTVSGFVHGMEFDGGENLQVYGNTISFNGGREMERSGIDLYEVVSGRVYDNTIDSNNVGVYSYASKAVVELNRITNSSEMQAIAERKAANMTRNWWGTAAFEEILPMVSSKVDFSFWCLDESCTSFADPIVLDETNSSRLGLDEISTDAVGIGNFIGNTGTSYSSNMGFKFSVNGTLYYVDYYGIYTIDVETGQATFQTSLIRPPGYYDANIYSMAIDPTDGTAYVTLHTHENGWWCRDKLATLDLATGQLTYIADVYKQYGGYEALAFDSEGQLYGAYYHYLHRINKTTGSDEFVANIGEIDEWAEEPGALDASYSNYYQTYGLVFGTNGKLYGSGYDESRYRWSIYTIDVSTGDVSVLAYPDVASGFSGETCYDLAESADGKLYCYNWGNNGAALVEVEFKEGKLFGATLALGYGKSFAYPFDGLLVLPNSTDFDSLRSSSFAATGLAEGRGALASFAWGVPGETLEFDPALQISIWIGDAYNGLTYPVLRSSTGTGSWTTDGLADTTCTVAGGYCTFWTNKASYFAVTYSLPVSPTPSSGGGAPVTCRPGFELSVPASAETSGDFAEIPVTLKVTGTCTDYGTALVGTAPAGWRVDIGSTGLLQSGQEQTLTATVLVPEGADGIVTFTARIGGVDYTAETQVTSTKGAGQEAAQQPEEETTTTVAPTTTTVAPEPPQPPVGQTGFFTGLFTAFQNFWGWLTGLFG